MRALEIRDHPAVQTADHLMRDLDMLGRDPPSSGMKIAFGSPEMNR